MSVFCWFVWLVNKTFLTFLTFDVILIDIKIKIQLAIIGTNNGRKRTGLANGIFELFVQIVITSWHLYTKHIAMTVYF